MADEGIPFQYQVGGHPGLRATADGSRIIKPCLPSERHFYQSVISANAQSFKLLSKHVPAFYGVTPAGTDGKDKCSLASFNSALCHRSLTSMDHHRVLYWKTSLLLSRSRISSTLSWALCSTRMRLVKKRNDE